MNARVLIHELRALLDAPFALAEGEALPVGTKRTWGGQNYEKQRDMTWKKVSAGRRLSFIKGGPARRQAAPEPAAKAPAKAAPEPEKKAAPKAEPKPEPKAAPTVAKLPEKPKKTKRGKNPLLAEPTVPPPDGPVYDVDPTADEDGDGVGDAARVGICGRCVHPPGSIPRLPNLTADERDVESRFADAFETNADAMVDEYQRKLDAREMGDAPNVYSTDDAKLLSPDYNPPAGAGGADTAKKEAMGRYNVVVHQTSNAIAKRAFLKKLDELAALPADDPKRSVLITSGGVASGKGYALGNVEETKALAGSVGAVWDSAGEQNGTENPWVLEEALKRGLKPTFVFVDSDPKETWENPKRGVIERAKRIGRMVDARVFSDSYTVGARNFQAFHEQNKDKADFVILSSRDGKPKRVDSVPEIALKQDEDELYDQALDALHNTPDLAPAIRRGGSIGERIWQEG